jgi:recombinational DNA repair ATPase RecF
LTLPAWGGFFQGKNGSGKTNILEAIHLLSSYKSFRGAQPRVLLRHGAEESLVEGTFLDSHDLENRISLAFGNKKKALF